MNGRAFVKELGKKARRKFAICLSGSPLNSSMKKYQSIAGTLGLSVLFVKRCMQLCYGSPAKEVVVSDTPDTWYVQACYGLLHHSNWTTGDEPVCRRVNPCFDSQASSAQDIAQVFPATISSSDWRIKWRVGRSESFSSDCLPKTQLSANRQREV